MLGRLVSWSPLLLAVVAGFGVAIVGGNAFAAGRVLLSLIVIVGILAWQARRAARTPEFAARRAVRQTSRLRAQVSIMMFFVAICVVVAVLARFASRDPGLERMLMPYMEVGPLLVFVLGVPLFLLWRRR